MEYTFEPTLFLSGDYEAQKLCKKGTKIRPFIRKHYLYSILLSSKVNMPAGCYYQSNHTQNLVFRNEKLFLPYNGHPALAELSIGDDRDSFAEDTKIKGSWFPEKYGYDDEVTIQRLTRRIKNIPPSPRSGRMRKRLTRNISKDINSPSKVKETLAWKLESDERAAELLKPLQAVIEVQKYAILPTYIQMEMDKHGLEGQNQKRWLDFILFKNYAQSCEEAYNSYCNNPLSIFYDDDFRFIYPFRLDYRDTNLFSHFMKIFPFPKLDKIERLNIKELTTLKYSPEFRMYLNCYKSVVQAIDEELQTIILDRPSGGAKFYDTYYDKVLEQHKREKETFRTQLVDNVESAVTLYKILKYPFLQSRHFQEWLSCQKTDGLPTIQLLSCIKDKKHGILKAYIHELFQNSKNICHAQRQKEKPKEKVNKSNIAILFGNGTINQKIDCTDHEAM